MDVHEQVGGGSYGVRVLLVDDEEAFREMMACALERRGFYVRTADSGEACLQRVESEAFDVVILDLEMPGMGGMETLLEISHRRLPLQVIVVTGYGTLTRGIQAMKAHAFDFLSKPVLVDELASVIHAAVQQREARTL